MTAPSSAREALIAEALGEMSALLERLEAVAPALEASRLAVVGASNSLADQVDAYERRMTVLTENAKAQALRHIARRTEELAREPAQAQIRAMEEAARLLFRTEVGPALHRVAIPMQHLANLAHRGAHPWQTWLTHAATAGVASGVTWALAAWWWAR